MPVTQRQLTKLAHLTDSKEEQAELLSFQHGTAFTDKFLKNRFSILDVLEDYPGINLPFTEYLGMLQPLAPRQYSISSSPLAHHRHVGDPGGSGQSSTVGGGVGEEQEEDGGEILTASISYDVHSAPAWSGRPQGRTTRTFHGVCSAYLSQLTAGSRIRCFVRATNSAFHLPADVSVPIIMVAAGTGIAPMRGFIEERAAMIRARRGGSEADTTTDTASAFAPALLYYGCRDFAHDYMYRDQLAEWAALGAVSVRPCFSRRGPPPQQQEQQDGHGHGYRYTSDRIWAEREELAGLFARGAKIFLCGSASKLAKSTRDTCVRIWLEMRPGRTVDEAEAWFEGIREERYVSDVFG